MVREGVVLGHLVSGKGLEVYKVKIEVIQNLPLPTILRDLRNFLGHVGFYRMLIRDFPKVSKPLTNLLCKDKEFFIDKEGECMMQDRGAKPVTRRDTKGETRGGIS